ncbi:MAG: Thioesterase superfamily protein [Pelotomaculum sp. PtaB.Bin117]|nr:MAG: Thioesterase superfamily protein [Pelotomaculum sp. PtaB.Bin117]
MPNRREGETMAKFLREDNMCFACSARNPIGLKLKFEQDGDICRTYFIARTEHQGWNGVLHGGLVATLLDEVMAQWLWVRDIATMTAEITTRYSKAVPVGERLTLEANLLSDRRRLVEMTGRLILPDGTVAARAKAKFLKMDPEKMSKGELKLEQNRGRGAAEEKPDK